MGRFSVNSLHSNRTLVGISFERLFDGEERNFTGLVLIHLQFEDEAQLNLLTRLRQHCNWHEPHGWKHRLNDVQLLIQPFILFCVLKPWHFSI